MWGNRNYVAISIPFTDIININMKLIMLITI